MYSNFFHLSITIVEKTLPGLCSFFEYHQKYYKNNLQPMYMCGFL